MLHSAPLAYFYTFSTYGAWLHGDQRGSVNRKGDTFEEHYVAPNPELEKANRDRMKQGAFAITPPLRATIRKSIEEFCLHKNLRLLALNIRVRHVHVVVAGDAPPHRVLHGLKAWATRALREGKLVAADRRIWTSGGSKRKCLTREDVAEACRYVLERQGADLPEG